MEQSELFDTYIPMSQRSRDVCLLIYQEMIKLWQEEKYSLHFKTGAAQYILQLQAVLEQEMKFYGQAQSATNND